MRTIIIMAASAAITAATLVATEFAGAPGAVAVWAGVFAALGLLPEHSGEDL